MSYIRMGQDGQYVDIPGGSNYYLYDNGDDIGGWSHAQFAALIGSVADEIERSPMRLNPHYTSSEMIRAHFGRHFGGWDDDYFGGITPPERAEIFCQCVDRRIDGIELTDELHEAVQDWVGEFDALRECEYCGTEFAPLLYADDTSYVCGDEECVLKQDADLYGVTLDEMKYAEEAFGLGEEDEFMEYMTEHSDDPWWVEDDE